MRTGISITPQPSDRGLWQRSLGIATPRITMSGAPRLSANGVGTHEIMRRAGKPKACVWRWQERFILAGCDGLLRDKKRHSRILPTCPGKRRKEVAASIKASAALAVELAARGLPVTIAVTVAPSASLVS
jgi:hypothetical protein